MREAESRYSMVETWPEAVKPPGSLETDALDHFIQAWIAPQRVEIPKNRRRARVSEKHQPRIPSFIRSFEKLECLVDLSQLSTQARK